MSPSNEQILVATRAIPIPADHATQEEWDGYDLAVARAALGLVGEPALRAAVVAAPKADDAVGAALEREKGVVMFQISLEQAYRRGFQRGFYNPLRASRAGVVMREPLTDSELAQIWDNALDLIDTRDQLRFVARAIERAHGIGQREDRPEVLAAIDELARDVASAAGSVGQQDKGADHA